MKKIYFAIILSAVFILSSCDEDYCFAHERGDRRCDDNVLQECKSPAGPISKSVTQSVIRTMGPLRVNGG